MGCCRCLCTYIKSQCINIVSTDIKKKNLSDCLSYSMSLLYSPVAHIVSQPIHTHLYISRYKIICREDKIDNQESGHKLMQKCFHSMSPPKFIIIVHKFILRNVTESNFASIICFFKEKNYMPKIQSLPLHAKPSI